MLPLRVLVVDDDEGLRDLLAHALAGPDYRVTVAATAGAALDGLRGQPVDVVLCDVRVADADGTDLLRQVKSHDAAVEILVMTGPSTVAAAVAALKLGAYDYLTKPVIPEALRNLLGHIRERRMLREEVQTLRERPAGALPTLAEAERELVLRALALHGNDRARAARALGLSPRTLYRRLKEYGLR